MGKADWSPRHGHVALTTSKDWMVVFGGHDGTGYLNDVWGIEDPSQALVYSTWENMGTAPWHERYGHAAVVDSHDMMLLLGGFFSDKETGVGYAYNDVWRSQDGGRSWEMVKEHSEWSGRYQHSAVIDSNDNIFIIGGIDADLSRCSDAWRSKNSGQSWQEVTSVATWEPRYMHTVVIDPGDNIFLLGGLDTDDLRFNDVWRSMQTCKDLPALYTGLDPRCSGDSVCRDHVNGVYTAICLNLCDRRVFNKCLKEERCEVLKNVPACVNPCKAKECAKGEVCEVAHRGNAYEGKMLENALAYCLSCQNAKTKFACDKLRQCKWNTGDEECQVRCSVAETDKACGKLSTCEWDSDDKKCKKS